MKRLTVLLVLLLAFPVMAEEVPMLPAGQPGSVLDLPTSTCFAQPGGPQHQPEPCDPTLFPYCGGGGGNPHCQTVSWPISVGLYACYTCCERYVEDGFIMPGGCYGPYFC